MSTLREKKSTLAAWSHSFPHHLSLDSLWSHHTPINEGYIRQMTYTWTGFQNKFPVKRQISLYIIGCDVSVFICLYTMIKRFRTKDIQMLHTCFFYQIVSFLNYILKFDRHCNMLTSWFKEFFKIFVLLPLVAFSTGDAAYHCINSSVCSK